MTNRFPALDAIHGIRAIFTRRVPGLDVCIGREEALGRLEPFLLQVRKDAGLGDMTFATAEQVHGNRVAEVSSDSLFPIPNADGLLTTVPGICLGVYVADCAAVFLADRHAQGIALVHSGKKGTELGIAAAAAKALCAATGGAPSDLVAQISPCIRPPHYEIDFASNIVRQLKDLGVGEVHDCGICTASNPDSYYSYRLEKGRTGRMLAMLAILPEISTDGEPQLV
ncbi:MAG: polyphenol oxidase family protein [Verrucomicrobiota bacterium]